MPESKQGKQGWTGGWHWERARTLQHLHDASGNCFAYVSMPVPTGLEYKAAAALIAAAPDLAQALEAILNSVQFHHSHESVKQQARLALKKARGESCSPITSSAICRRA